MIRLKEHIFRLALAIMLLSLLGACSTLMPRQLASEQKKWEKQTEENTFLDLFDFRSRKNLKIQRMVQVGMKDGAPIYDFVEEPEDGSKESEGSGGDSEKPNSEEEGEKSSTPATEKKPKALAEADSEEYLKALANIRKQKIEREVRVAQKVETPTVDTKLHVDFEGVDQYKPRLGKYGSYKKLTQAQKEEEFKITLAKVKEAFHAGLKVYAQEEYVDSVSTGKKGAAHMVWTKYPKGHSYQIEVLRGNRLYSIVQQWHVMHIMIYWDNEYVWRVRLVDSDGKPKSTFTDWKIVKVTRPTPTMADTVETSPEIATVEAPKEIEISEEEAMVFPSAPESERDPANSTVEDLYIDMGN